MRDSIALQRYLQRHIEPGLPAAPPATRGWQDVLVVPAYRESADLLQCLARLPAGNGRTLVILVLNRPHTDPDPQANASLRRALEHGPPLEETRDGVRLYRLRDHCDVCVYDLEMTCGPTPATQGVGLARKTGCDIALKWWHEGAIGGDWIYSSDADALLPRDYFLKLGHATPETAAAVFPFRHAPGPDPECNEATALYELRLHHYVLGLEHGGSPYAYHSLGSCLAVRVEAYAQVRGFPRRSGGEDFYLLNKVSKLGPVARPGGECIQLQSRYSQRVPFGTGPAVAEIAAAQNPAELPLFYHPQSFAALRCVLGIIPSLQPDGSERLSHLLSARGLPVDLVQACDDILTGMGAGEALAHCRRQGKTPGQYLRQFHQWFDAFRSLKFIHALRDRGWRDQSLPALASLEPQLWPTLLTDPGESGRLLDALNRHWGWERW